MKTTLFDIRYLLVLAALQLAGCSTIQSATFSTPVIESKDIPQYRYADGIAFEHLGMCIAIREGSFSAEYRNVTAGPLIFPVIPVEVFPGRDYAEYTFYAIRLDFVRLENYGPIRFDAAKVQLTLTDGSVVSPYASSVGGPFTQLPPKTYMPNRLELRFRKGNSTVQMSEIKLKGFYQEDIELDFPTVKFGPRTTHHRILLSGRFKDNTPTTTSWKHGTRAEPPKCE